MQRAWLRTSWWFSLIVLVGLAGCERLFDKGAKDDVSAGDKKVSAGDFRAAVAFYESALDGTAKTAEAHYKLALLYEDKLKSPLDALHHIGRYLELNPTGTHVKEAKSYQKEGEQRLLTLWSKGSPITQEDAVRLKNDNQFLREQVAKLRAQRVAPSTEFSGTANESVQKLIPPGARTYTVKSGDTLASIAAKFYRNKGRWKDIQDANFNSLEGTVKIKAGMTLIIP